MRKVIAFALILAVALGGLVFAHASVTDQQDELLVYAQLQSGDLTPLAGRTASVTIDCGEHLRWYTDYTFGGGITETRFEFTQFPEQAEIANRARLDVYFSGGMGASVSGGSFDLQESEYSAMMRAVAVITPAGGSETMNLRMADYVNYYAPDYDLDFQNGELSCSQSMSLHGLIDGGNWYEDPTGYKAFFRDFRFPVQGDHVVSVTVEKDGGGMVCGFSMNSENGPELYYVSSVNDSGVYFVPIFRDQKGNPLPFESPEGFGIYFAPWRDTGNTVTVSENSTRREVTPDMDKVRLIRPLDDTLRIEAMEISADGSEAWMLTLEEAGYVLTAYDLAGGNEVRLEVLPYDETIGDAESWFVHNGGLLMVLAQDNLALVDMEAKTLELTAPQGGPESAAYHPKYWDASSGHMEYDGEYLYLLDTTYDHDGLFWAAVYREGEQVYYGLYDCSILRGNDDWHYSSITAEMHPITLN